MHNCNPADIICHERVIDLDTLFYTAGSSPALTHAAGLLKKAGFAFADHTDLAVTHLLLPVPSFTPKELLVGGENIQTLLPQLSKDITVIGGNLSHPALTQYPSIDLLRDEMYLAKNAAITAHCAIRLAMQHLPATLEGCPVLVIGWGRIGKCLARLLKGLGAEVTVAARKSTDRAMLSALGYTCVPIIDLDVSAFRVIFNTVPVVVLHGGGDALKIDLASKQGILAEDVLWARGLPGKDAPETSGQLIAETVIRSLR